MLIAEDKPIIAQHARLSGKRPNQHVTELVQVHRRGLLPIEGQPPPTVMLCTEAGKLRPFREIEADVIRLAIEHHQGRMSEVARQLRIGRSTLYRKVDHLGIKRKSTATHCDSG